jgi:uncharacterized protein (TIGR02118 family)
MSEVKLIVLYPYPADVRQFDKDYDAHLRLLNEKAGAAGLPYKVTRIRTSADRSRSPYHVMFVAYFPSLETLQKAMSTPELQEVAADAVRISTGGPPVMMIGTEG